MPPTSKHRVFISYSHDDQHLFDAVRTELFNAGLNPWSDHDLAAGKGFTEQIQTCISHSHLFVPILTPRSHERGWVHQEIGYAVAMRVPCVPICVGKLPDGMITMAQAVVVDENLQNLQAKLARVDFRQLVEDSARQWVPPSGCAREPEERAAMIEQFSSAAFANIGAACVRVQGGLSSFSIPNEAPDHPFWAARYGNRGRSPYSYERFWHERIALERHAADAGVRMIINHGLDLDKDYGDGVKRTRMAILVRFLESLNVPDEKVAIALVSSHPPDLMLAVGDWYLAESLAGRPVRGVIQTVFVAHGPMVSSRIAEFDRKLDGLISVQGSPSGQSRLWAVAKLREIMLSLPESPFLPDYLKTLGT